MIYLVLSNNKQRITKLILSLALFTLAACGGGGDAGGGTSGDTNNSVRDTVSPVVTLIGSSRITLQQGATYTEQGATAVDDRDGILNVTISGEVNANTVGEYTRTYSATDLAGNTGTATRTVLVEQQTNNVIRTYIQVFADDQKITIRWEPVVDAVGYQLHWNNAGKVQETDEVLLVPAGATSFTHGNLINSTTYYYRLVANYADGGKRLSHEFSSIPVAANLKWQWANPLPQGTELSRSIWNGSRYVSVGMAGTILTSTDGNTWSRTNATRENLFGVTWNGTQFMAVGVNGAIETSPDGLEWTLSNTGLHLYDVKWTGSQYVAVGELGEPATSTDGIRWTKHSSAQNSNPLYAVANNANIIVAVGKNGAILSSPMGDVWTRRFFKNTASLSDVIWNGSQFVAVGYAKGGLIVTSPDGLTWTERTSPTIRQITGIAWNGSTYLGVTIGADLIYSSDGINWTVVNSQFQQVLGLRDVTWGDNEFLAVGNAGLMYRSADGIDWTRIGSGEVFSPNRIIRGSDKFVAVGKANQIGTSVNGFDWVVNKIHETELPNTSFSCVTWNGSLYVAFSSQGTPLTSADGVDWNIASPSIGVSINDLVWGNNLLVAVGQAGRIYTSTNGINWNLQVSETTASLNKVEWLNNEFWVTGQGGIILHSVNGANWQTINLNTITTSLHGIAWREGQYVAVGGILNQLGVYFTSVDGVQWVRGGAIDTGLFHDVVWNGREFMLVGQKGLIYRSGNGNNWNLEHSGTNNSLSDIVWVGNRYIVVGDYTVITKNSL